MARRKPRKHSRHHRHKSYKPMNKFDIENSRKKLGLDKDKSANICNAHSCNNPSTGTCKYCHRSYCGHHLDAGIATSATTIFNLRQNEDTIKYEKYMNDWKRENMHPCPSYTEWWIRDHESQTHYGREVWDQHHWNSRKTAYEQPYYKSPRSQHRYDNYSNYKKPRKKINIAKILGSAFAILFIFVMYLLLFNPALPNGIIPILSPIVYAVELIIFVVGLILINGVNLGRSDLGIWLMGIFGIILIFLGVLFFFSSGFVPRAYLPYEAWFGIILGILGLFALFRTRRRYGTFVYFG